MNNNNNDMNIKILKPENYSTGLLRQIRQKIGINDVDMGVIEQRFFDLDVASQIQTDASAHLPSLLESFEKVKDIPVLILTKNQDPENHFKVKFTKNKLTDEQ